MVTHHDCPAYPTYCKPISGERMEPLCDPAGYAQCPDRISHLTDKGERLKKFEEFYRLAIQT